MFPSIPPCSLLAPEFSEGRRVAVVRRKDEVPARSEHTSHLAQGIQPAFMTGDAHKALA